MLACGPFFDEVGLIATLVILVVIKPYAYYAYIKAFRFRVSRAIPMTNRQAMVLAVWRAGIGLVLVGGGLLVLMNVGNANDVVGFAYFYLARVAAWWWVGSRQASIRGRRLVGWIIGGLLINVAFDGAAAFGLMTGWVIPFVIVAGIGAFITLVDWVGRRADLRNRFSSVPHCTSCSYNLTGNLSGICPECGTPIVTESVSS